MIYARTPLTGLAAVVIGAGIAVAPALPASAKTLKEVVERVVLSHPEIGAIRFNRRAIDQELRQARGAYLPSVDVRGAAGHEFSNNPATRNRASRTNGEGGGVSMNRYEVGINLRQLIFDGFGTRNEVRRQIGRAESAQYRVVDTVQAVGLRAVEAYLEVQRTQEIVRIAIRNVRTHEAILTRVRSRSTEGAGARSDVDQALARLAAARAALAASRGRYEDSVAAYIAVTAERPEGLEQVKAPELKLPSNIDEAVLAAVKNAPSIKAAAADARSAHAAVRVANSRFLPTVTAEVSTNYLYNIDGTRGPNRDFSALLVGRWNLYRGGIDISRKREAVARLFEARNVLERTRREVSQQTRVSWNALNAARERRVEVAAQLRANRKVQRAYSQQFDAGRRTLLDLLDIQNETFNNQTTLITEEFTITFGVYRTLATMGQLLETMEVQLPIEGRRAPAKNFVDGIRRHWGFRRNDLSR